MRVLETKVDFIVLLFREREGLRFLRLVTDSLLAWFALVFAFRETGIELSIFDLTVLLASFRLCLEGCLVIDELLILVLSYTFRVRTGEDFAESTLAGLQVALSWCGKFSFLTVKCDGIGILVYLLFDLLVMDTLALDETMLSFSLANGPKELSSDGFSMILAAVDRYFLCRELF